MRNTQLKLVAVILSFTLTAAGLSQQITRSRTEPQKSEPVRSTYILGPDEQITIRAPEADEFEKPFRIGAGGELNLPLVGRVRAAGLTVEQLEAELTSRLKEYIQDPQVFVGIAQFRSQPVSVIGAVNAPGVQQIQGPKALIELLSLAGGIRQDAGNRIKITRRLERGRIPLPNAKDDPTGQFSIAEVNVKEILEAKNPQENILVQPDDIISVPRAEMVYVIGDVTRAGGFVLNEQENISVLQALSLAGGPTKTASTRKAKLLRTVQGGSSRTEIPVDLRKVLAGKANDIALQPADILFVPNSTGKAATLRSLEAALSMGSSMAIGLAIYHP